ncbi:hypothetical protein C7458_11411 [Williamsia muralis]|nr:hypothetical protein C7458_11411 [Williamsia marianensis]
MAKVQPSGLKILRAPTKARLLCRLLAIYFIPCFILSRFYRGVPPAPIVVSVTTYPKRLRFAYFAVKSVMFQSPRRPSSIRVVLSRENFPEGRVPFKLKTLAKHAGGLVVFEFVDGDIRSYKKIVPFGGLEEGESLVTIDDDVVYSAGLINLLERYGRVFSDCIVGTRGYRMARTGTAFEPYSRWPSAIPLVVDPDTLLTGVGGILYPSNSLGACYASFSTAVSICPDGDDLWFKYAALVAGTPSVSIEKVCFIIQPFSQSGALWRKNIANGNDINIATLVARTDFVRRLEMLTSRL